MNPLEYKLNDEFVLEGLWSFNYGDEGVYGTLSHEENNTTILNLFGKLDLKNNRSNQISIIGKIKSDVNITYIVKAYIVSVYPLGCLEGPCDVNHFVILKENKLDNNGRISTFCDFGLNFLHLREWLPELDYDVVDKLDEKGIVFKNINSEHLGDINVNGKKYKLNIIKKVIKKEDREITGFGKEYFNKISYELDSKLEIKADKICIEEAVNICRSICGLFEILLDDYSKILYLGNSECNVFPKYIYPNKNIDEHKLYFTAINYDNIKLVDVINKWFQENDLNKNSCFHRLAANYMSNINNTSTMENTLLNITQGIEMYYAKNENFPNLLCKLINMFIKLPEKYAAEIAESTEYIADFNMKKIKKAFSHKYKNKFGENRYKITKTGRFFNSLKNIDFKKAMKLFYFIVELKDTRVHLTHGNDSRKIIFKDKNLKSAITILTEVVRMFILLKLGISEEELKYSVYSLKNIEKNSIDYKYDNFN